MFEDFTSQPNANSCKVSQQKTTDKIQLVFACAGLTIFVGISKDVASDNSIYYNYNYNR